LATAASVGHLILHHVSRRYAEREIMDEATPIFPNTVVARDLDHFEIRRQAPLVKVERSGRHGP
jgi:ribonuclease Z